MAPCIYATGSLSQVLEVCNGDSMIVKASGEQRKIFLSSIRPPRQAQPVDSENADDPRKKIRERYSVYDPLGYNMIVRLRCGSVYILWLSNYRTKPLYDIPYMFEAREFLRKKLIGKRVNVKVDYVQPAANNYPEKVCCTVTISNRCVVVQWVILYRKVCLCDVHRTETEFIGRDENSIPSVKLFMMLISEVFYQFRFF